MEVSLQDLQIEKNEIEDRRQDIQIEKKEMKDGLQKLQIKKNEMEDRLQQAEYYRKKLLNENLVISTSNLSLLTHLRKVSL